VVAVWRRSLPILEPLDDERLGRVDATVTTLLQDVGLRITEPRLLRLAIQAGLAVEDDLVRFDRAFVDEQVARAPATFEVHGRDPARNVTLGGDHVVLAPTGGQPFITDPDGTRRYPTLDDYVVLTKLTHAAGPLHMLGSGIVECADLPIESRHLDMDRAVIRWSDEPYFGVGADTETTRDSIALAAIAAGGANALAERPTLMMIVNPISPLQYDERMGGSLFEAASAGVPVVLMPYLLAGATAPLGLAGAVAQAAAEALAGIALVQLVRPATPCVFGTYVVEIDMRSGLPIFGTPGAGLAVMVAGQLARRAGVPFRAGGAFTDVPASSIRGTQDSLLSLLPSLLAGGNLLFHAAGWLEGSLSTSAQKIAEDVEALERLERFVAAPFAVDDEALGLDAFAETGPGGIFLGADHTLRLLRAGAFTEPQPGEAASWEALLDRYEDPGIDPGVEAALDDHVGRRTRELTGVRV
jgi:trimethylamine--corrinoid protein Co-methyltransferase